MYDSIGIMVLIEGNIDVPKYTEILNANFKPIVVMYNRKCVCTVGVKLITHYCLITFRRPVLHFLLHFAKFIIGISRY